MSQSKYCSKPHCMIITGDFQRTFDFINTAILNGSMSDQVYRREMDALREYVLDRIDACSDCFHSMAESFVFPDSKKRKCVILLSDGDVNEQNDSKRPKLDG